MRPSPIAETVAMLGLLTVPEMVLLARTVLDRLPAADRVELLAGLAAPRRKGGETPS